MTKIKRQNLKFFDPASDRLILRARAGSEDARRKLLQAIADQAVPSGGPPNPIQRLIQSAFAKAAAASTPENELLNQLGLRVAGRPRVELTDEQQDIVFSLASDLYAEHWRRASGVRMSKQCSVRRNQLAKSIGITPQAVNKILDEWVVGFEQDAEWKRGEAD